MQQNASTMESRSVAVETPSPHHVGVPQVPPNLIITALPPDPLKMIFRALPASNRFVAPVCRRFRDLYGEATKENNKHDTYKYSIASEAALEAYLKEKFNENHSIALKEKFNEGYRAHRDLHTWEHSTPKEATSMIGAGSGRTDWVKRGGVFDEDTCRAAATGGQLRVLKYLRGRGCPWDSGTCEGAARNGKLDVLQWAREKGCEWDSSTCDMAAMNGHLDVLKWARENGGSLDISTCYKAASGGHLEVLQWARGKGCPWNSVTCEMAAMNGHLKVLK